MESTTNTVKLDRNDNQALGIGKFAIEFMKSAKPSKEVIERVKLFHSDSVICGLSALALKTNAPTILQAEALEFTKEGSAATQGGAKVFGSSAYCLAEKAILANASAVREWDSNGTVFGYNAKIPGHQAGEFGHNDYYPVVVAACQQNSKLTGKDAVLGMILIDEIRGRLAEVFSLKTYKIDHVVHGAIASAATYGALLGATAEQIEHAIGMFVAHYIPFRAIRAGHQLSDSKGASAAISTEVAILSMKRAMKGFVGPKDIFRNPESIFRLNVPTKAESPFDIVLTREGSDFAVMGMHFKLGLYEHQSAGALEAVLTLLYKHRFLDASNPDNVESIKIVAYQPAFGIIGDPDKRDPHTRQSADHSMVYIVSSLLTKALKVQDLKQRELKNLDELWKLLMLEPKDYGHDAIYDKDTRNFMEKITFEHGGSDYDAKYPEGIPSSVVIKLKDGTVLDSGFVMFPSGHARNTSANLKDILSHKFKLLGRLALNEDELSKFVDNLGNLENLSNDELQKIYECKINYASKSIDD